jgi:hypothetical protein
MDSFRFGRSVQSVVIARVEGDEEAPAAVVYSKKKRKKKGSAGLRVLGKAVRGAFDAQRDFGETYEAAHDRSNLKQRDGWLIDLTSNLDKAGRKATRKLLDKL